VISANIKEPVMSKVKVRVIKHKETMIRMGIWDEFRKACLAEPIIEEMKTVEYLEAALDMLESMDISEILKGFFKWDTSKRGFDFWNEKQREAKELK